MPYSPPEAYDDDADEDITEGGRGFLGDYYGQTYAEEDFLENENEEELSEEEEDVTYYQNLGLQPEDISNSQIRTILQGALPHAGSQHQLPSSSASSNATQNTCQSTKRRLEAALQSPVHIDKYPSSKAGQPIEAGHATEYQGYQSTINNENVYAPFQSRLDWEVAQWAKLRGIGSNAFTELLSVPGVQERLGLSYKNSRELNKLVDSLPESRPRFHREEIVVAGEPFDVYYRDVLACIRSLYSDPEFARHLVFLPERHYSDADKTLRLYHDMHTGKWWWAAQKLVEEREEGGTILPVIISSDKTQVTLFRNKTAYPVYITIGNLPKDIRSKPSQGGQILLAYLPTTKLEHITNKLARRRTLANLFHACLGRILSPLCQAGLDGIPMTSGDGVSRRVHPLFAAYVCDYPEQVLVTCIKSGDCPICKVPRDELGEFGEDDNNGDEDNDEDNGGGGYELREVDEILDILDLFDESPVDFVRACEKAGVKPTSSPFWKDLPYADIYMSITPDILHQLLQGIVKHVFAWIKKAYNQAELDARSQRLPPNHNVRLFTKGITSLSRLTGREHADLCRILLGLVPGMQLPNHTSSVPLIKALRAVLDFVYLAQYPIHTAATLSHLEDALRSFHENKTIFVDLGIRANFNLPKLHFMRHYRMLIENLGTADNFNTEYTERLHIDFAKDAYNSTNHKDEYPQMTIWLERKEKILTHARYIQWRAIGRPPSENMNPLYSSPSDATIRMTKHPSAKRVSFERLASAYGAAQFRDCLAQFVAQHREPNLSGRQLNHATSSVVFGSRAVHVYHKAKFWDIDFPHYRHASRDYDVAHACPGRQNTRGSLLSGRFDTVIVRTGSADLTGITGHRIAQLRVIFTIPPDEAARLFPHGRPPPKYLAYVEWFSPFPRAPDPVTNLYRVSRPLPQEHRSASVIPLTDIRRSIQLFPEFGDSVPQEWSSSSVLENCSRFYVNSFTDRHTYGTII